jgi:cell division protein ZapA
MSEVTLKINNRGYSLSCDPGQEQRLVDLSYYVDSRLKDIASAGAATNEAHLLVLTALVLADEIYDLKEQLAEAQAQQAAGYVPAVVQGGAGAEDEAFVTHAIDHLADRIAMITNRLKIAA